MEASDDLEKRTLYSHLREVGEQLLCETSFHREALSGMLEEVLEDIHSLHRGYEQPAPTGAEAVQGFVLEALDLYAQCVEAMQAHLEDPEESRVQWGLERAEEAEDILTAVETVIQENKDLLGEGLMR